MKYRNLFTSNVFAFDSEYNILEEEDLGICADIASVMTPEFSVCALKTMQACPLSNTAFSLDVRVDGERIRASHWRWLPHSILRTGQVGTWEVETISTVLYRKRAVVEKITVTNHAAEVMTVPFQIQYAGCVNKVDTWAFSIPAPKYDQVTYSWQDGIMTGTSDRETAYAVTTSAENVTWFRQARLLEAEITLVAEESKVLYVACHMGTVADIMVEAKEVQKDYEKSIADAFVEFSRQSNALLGRIPAFSSDSKELNEFYYRSLVTYLLCKWENPDMYISPYYSTGSVNGACMCTYLWDYCGGLMLHPVADPMTNKEEIRAYLTNDITRSYALNPVDGSEVGPWYQVNQEKVICMAYYHVLHTGDVGFLFEQAGDRTVLDKLIFHAYICDDVTKPVALYDYGKGGYNHLELRLEKKYDGIMPDLNARRYMNYMRVYELTKLAGRPEERLLERAAALKEALKPLWNKAEKWYNFISADGKRDLLYTVQMFKFLNSPVIDQTEREGLISHLNEREFLSKFGLHSISKLDEEYNQDDIDNGGGGICTHFTMQICAQLYETGHDTLATDILKRVLWWRRLPYLGDSCAANMLLNRPDTPLQGDISSVSCAQMIIFYLFGIKARFDGSIEISPAKHRPAEKMRLENIRLQNKRFSVYVDGNEFTVKTAKDEIGSLIGNSVTI